MLRRRPGIGALDTRLRVGTCAVVVLLCASCAAVPSPGDAVLPSQPVPTQDGGDAAAPLASDGIDSSASGTAGADGDAVTVAAADESNAAADLVPDIGAGEVADDSPPASSGEVETGDGRSDVTATTMPPRASGDADETTEQEAETPIGTRLPSAPFKGVVYAHTDPPLVPLGPVYVQLINTDTGMIDVVIVPEVLVQGCLYWPVADVSGVQMGVYGERVVGEEHEELWSGAVGAAWGDEFEIRSSTDRLEVKQRMFAQTAGYGPHEFELQYLSRGFSLRSGDVYGEYVLGEDVGFFHAGSDYEGESDGSDGVAWLAGSNGDVLAVSAYTAHTCGGSYYVYFISLSEGRLLTCVTADGPINLVTTAPADDIETWPEEILFPPSGLLHDEPCIPFDAESIAQALATTSETDDGPDS